ncbi:MAG: sialidase family protein [Nitrososphaeraceae archaeon]
MNSYSYKHMIIPRSNLEPLGLDSRLQLKFILFTVIMIGSLLYYNEIFAIDEIDGTLNDDDSNNKTLASGVVFSNVTNITNNTKDSVYAQIVANGNNVYVVWQESITGNPYGNNYEIYFKKSEDNGNTFSKPINLSNNTGFSEHPQIAASKNGIFIVWADNTDSNNTEIMFTKSVDNGTTFSKPINLSNNSQNSNNQEISAFNENVYVVWQDIDQNNNNNKNSSIMFKSSIDSGNTFNDTIELATNTNDTYPKVNSYQDYVYIVWNSEENNNLSKDNKNSGLFFIKSSNKGNNFENSIRIAHNNFGESQISVSKDEVFIVWGGLYEKNINDIYFVQSDDNGTSFTDPYTIQEKVSKPESKNQSDKINHPTNVEITNNDPAYIIVWQDIISKENQDIFITNIKNDFQSTKILNLSNNTGISECPQIAVSKNFIYVVWEDITTGNHEIFFTRGQSINK